MVYIKKGTKWFKIEAVIFCVSSPPTIKERVFVLSGVRGGAVG